MTMELSAEAYTAWQDEAQRERLLMDQLPQVRYIARRIHEHLPRHVPFEDLVHAGVVGLIDALHKYDQKKQVQFASYAKFRIRGAILDSLREKESQVLVLYYFQELTMKEVGAKLGVGESRVSQIHSTAVVRLWAAVILDSSKASGAILPPRLETDVRPQRSLRRSPIKLMT